MPGRGLKPVRPPAGRVGVRVAAGFMPGRGLKPVGSFLIDCNERSGRVYARPRIETGGTMTEKFRHWVAAGFMPGRGLKQNVGGAGGRR